MENKIVKLTYSSQLENLPLIVQAIKEHCTDFVKDEWLLYQLELCASEVITNIIIHAYEQKIDQFIEIEMNLSPSCIEFKFFDSGKRNDYSRAPEIEPENIADWPESGRGLDLIQQFMDEVKIGIEHGKNMTTLKKRLS